MQSHLTRRSLLKTSGLALGASFLPTAASAANSEYPLQNFIHLNLNENAFGSSPSVVPAIQREFSFLSRYADAALAQAFAEQIAFFGGRRAS
jgi:histidinol-phosphate aminotransferase